MNKCMIFLNSPYLGGAERSIILQSLSIKKHCQFIVPSLANDRGQEIIKFIQETKSDHSFSVEILEYPEVLYKVSRSGTVGKFFTLLYSFLFIFIELRRLQINSDDIVWINGNKIGFPVLLYLAMKKFAGRLIWHFRDYPYNHGIFKLVWKILKRESVMDTVLVSNSLSVTSEVKTICNGSHLKYVTLYNPVGSLSVKRQRNSNIRSIGIVSMFAPWKGIHTILEFERMYRDELIGLGITSIDIFGGNIYQTSGAHDNYLDQLKTLHSQESLVNFRGRMKPSKIYSEIDLLIHPSIEKEPFGRIIIEAFSCEIPVISTGLGGSGELVLDEKTGLTYLPYDYPGLFEKISKMTKMSIREQVITGASHHLNKIENEQSRSIRELVFES